MPELMVIDNPRRRRKGKKRRCRIVHRVVCRRKGSKRRSRKSTRRLGSYARFTKSQWYKHRAHFKRIGIKRAAKLIATAWKKRR